MSAENCFGDAGVAVLAPSLVGMAQLTSLDLGGVLSLRVPHAHGPWLRTGAVAWCVLRRLAWGVNPAAGTRVESGDACRQSSWRRGCGVSGTESPQAAAADVVGPQWYSYTSAALSCRVLTAPFARVPAWCGGCTTCELEGRRCVQTIASKTWGRRHWHRASWEWRS